MTYSPGTTLYWTHRSEPDKKQVDKVIVHRVYEPTREGMNRYDIWRPVGLGGSLELIIVDESELQK